MSKQNHHCPACSASLVSEPINTPLRCTRCDWKLISRAKWQQLSPHEQGYVLYMQSNWPTSELQGAKNPYAKNTREWLAFIEGERRAMLSTLDGEE